MAGVRPPPTFADAALELEFLEAVLRDRRDAAVDDLPMERAELTTRRYATVRTTAPLRLVDLREDRAIRMGIPTDVARASPQSLARAWPEAFYTHAEQPDGVIYPSRLNGMTNLAVYNRAVPTLAVVRVQRLIGAAGLADVLTALNVALI